MTLFARHRVAPNLLMVMMLLAGVIALTELNKQFFPSFALQFANVRVSWTGATAEDVETAIAVPIEQELRTLDDLHKLFSTSSEGGTTITLEYQEGTDMGSALDQIKERVGLLRNLPTAAEDPEISRVVRYEPVANLLLTGPKTVDELRGLTNQIERELLDAGLDKVTIRGLPDEEIAIQVSNATLRDLNLSLDDIASRIGALSRDIPAGTIGRNDVARQLRGLEQSRREIEFEKLPILSDENGRLITLGDIATVERRARPRQATVQYRGEPAVELRLGRAESGDSLEAAAILNSWVADARKRLPSNVNLIVYDESWSFIRDRINLLLKNGLGGLILVVSILFFFLNGRVAFWVAVGIPVSFMAALGVLLALGGSINMISLFALIMTLGIIVDDAIVVGEDALAHYQRGAAPLEAAERGAWRMLAPVMSSSLTTIAAFLPLMLISGIIGNILFDIPLVVICVIVASLIESFLVLPGHLRQSFVKLHKQEPKAWRRAIDERFERFKEGTFRRLVTHAVDNASVTICAALCLLLLVAGMAAGGRIPFNFFPTPESSILYANIGFVSGTAPEQVRAQANLVEQALYSAEKTFEEPLVKVTVTTLGALERREGRSAQSGDQFASIMVELVEPDARSVRNPQLIEAWKSQIPEAAGIENFSIVERRAGPPGRDVDVRLTGGDRLQLKAAALALVNVLTSTPGVTGVQDDMPFGPEQIVYKLTPRGQSLGLTVQDVGNQLRAAYDGRIAQIFQAGADELEVRVLLTDEERFSLASLENFSILTASGENIPLLSIVDISTQRGFELLRHVDGQLSVQISADIDPAVTTTGEMNEKLLTELLPPVQSQFGVSFDLEGRAADQRETLGDMRRGALYASVLIYLVLAWVFGSYAWPLVVMLAIPFGLVGALLGHWILDVDLTILSLFGFFGLSGIVVNDSIILVTFFKELREAGVDARNAIIEAACQRLRAVMLTSLTTIAGLLPLLFETSLQAQFLVPMAISISFGLAFATVLVLLFVPAMLGVYELSIRGFLDRRKNAITNEL
ncbi:MAG: efflux RND transporter permease subunit [Gammaproteobacteria bacterium]|nr:efflux RND transporter permease subunit [Gammaproteobacteria bacterium]